MDELKRAALAAVASTFVLICFLLIIAMCHSQQTELWGLAVCAFVLVQTTVSIHLWMQWVKKYVDYALRRDLITRSVK